ncbi:MAG: hypothetical protein AAFX94_24870, partial [Myxococcota bacterium]
MDRNAFAERVKWGILRRFNRHHFSVLRDVCGLPGGRRLLRQFWNRRIWDNYLFAPGLDGQQLMFIHIPKCAGTSIARMLLGTTLPCVPAYPYALTDPDRFAQTFSFAVLRDPALQIASTLYHLERSEWAQPADKRFFERERLGERSIDELLERFALDRVFRRRLFTETFIGRSGMIMRPHEFLEFEGRVIVSRIYAFDRLDRMVEELSERTGRRLRLPHENASRLGGASAAVDSRVTALLRTV